MMMPEWSAFADSSSSCTWWTERSGTGVASLPPSRRWSLVLLNDVVERKDGYTSGHCHRVYSYAFRLGQELGLPREQLSDLLIAAAFHDIGKVGIVSSVLNKAGPLDQFEWAVMRMHPLLGCELWESIVPSLSQVADIIRQHHARWDGTGYPEGLAGEEIRIEARVLSVVDAYDAMCTDRPYRPALGQPVIRAELYAGMGTQFGPEAAAAFIEIIEGRQRQAA